MEAYCEHEPTSGFISGIVLFDKESIVKLIFYSMVVDWYLQYGGSCGSYHSS